MENQQAIEQLTDLIHSPLIGDKQVDFAASLVQQHMTKKTLSSKQWYWVQKIVAEAAIPKSEKRVSTVKVGDFAGVIALFNKAKENLKWPKITVTSTEGLVFQFSMSGAKAKKPGTINITDGKPFGENVWYGRVEADGTWEQSKKAFPEIAEVLNALAIDPAGFATKYGKKTGHCCFCNKHLKTENSVAAGFGPVCADNFGLKEQWKQAAK